MGRVSRDPAHRDGVAADALLFPDPDMVMVHDGLLSEAKQTLDAIGIDRIHAPEKTMVVSDHDVLYGSARAAERGAYNRKAVKHWKIQNFYDAGRGGHGHIFPMEEGLVLPGMFYFDNDTHATNAGAVGAVGLRVGNEIARSVVDSSPFSTSGALTVANTPAEKRDYVFKRLMQWGMSMVLIAPPIAWLIFVVPGWL